MMEWITIAAIILGPIFAVQAQKWIERASEKRRERLLIFKTLMRTRGNVMSPDHVNALNMISIEFAGKNESHSNVRRKWEIYLNHLFSPYPTPDQGKEVEVAFVTERAKRLTDLLMAIAKALGFKLDEEDIRRVYAPVGYSKEAAENQQARQLLLELLRGKGQLNIALFPGNPDLSKEFNDLLIRILKGEAAIKVEAQKAIPSATYLNLDEPRPKKI